MPGSALCAGLGLGRSTYAGWPSVWPADVNGPVVDEGGREAGFGYLEVWVWVWVWVWIWIWI